MSSFRELALTAALLGLVGGAAAQRTEFAGIGRTATPKEIAAWDIDVRPDFKGLPQGSGSVAKGQEVWEGKCSSCHGIFGESGQVFNPIVGGTTKEDVKTGRVARLNDPAYPGRTTLMKVSTVSTLWDYIRRAMPWMQPKSLTTDEVYAVTAYILNLGGVLPDDYVMSDRNIGEVQKLLPNRNGMTTQHALWPGTELGGAKKPDVQGSSCMSNCPVEAKITSFMPDSARNAHGNLALQNRPVGAQHGIDTGAGTSNGSSDAKPAASTAAATPAAVPGRAASSAAAPATNKPATTVDAAAAIALTQKHACVACHAMTGKIIGPAFQDVAKKYAGRADAAGHLAARIRSGGSGIWGAMPMPPQSLPEADAQSIARWLAAGAPR